eukprot:CAMPEP_0114121458 /NCGR_PEP_ID=MMETSP0043_2-20121206/7188_1 /TAXON_ID=464988 /ORGANISM="Hemiselmis andersenii, Strain CCMP644" /LENGTH=185 /DNA_ID=CAMNT_0001214139 /DNA_START=91 /DNA_END=645 /DNA_ORIENTATION=+
MGYDRARKRALATRLASSSPSSQSSTTRSSHPLPRSDRNAVEVGSRASGAGSDSESRHGSSGQREGGTTVEQEARAQRRVLEALGRYRATSFWQTRAQCVGELGDQGGDMRRNRLGQYTDIDLEVLGEVRKAASDWSEQVRVAALIALSKLSEPKDSANAEVCLKALHDFVPAVRRAAADSLCCI